MEIYSITNFEELKNLNFHDDVLQNIVINYKNKEILIHLIKTGTKDIKPREIGLFFIEAYNLHVPMVEPWGRSHYVYVYSIEFKEHSDKQIITRILLQTGDEITCIAKAIKIQ